MNSEYSQLYSYDMTLTVLHSILGYLLSFRSDIIIPCFRKFAINLWFTFLVCILSKTKSRLLCEDGFSYCGRGNTTWTCNKRINGPPLCLLSYTPTKVADNALPGMVRSREIESRTPRLKVGYSTDWVTSTCRASSVPCLWEHSFEESHFRCAWKWALVENGRVEQPLSGSKPDALPFGESSNIHYV